MVAGGVRTLLYGGNANFYNIGLSEFAGVLDALEGAVAAETTIIPSIGPFFGMAMDQAAVLAGRSFPTAMLLPTVAVSTAAGVRRAVMLLAERIGRPLVLYIKDENYVTVEVARALAEARAISWIKYAVVRPDPSADPLLRALCDVIDPRMIVSGIGEQPAPAHLREFGLGGFTTGCGCLAPRLSVAMLAALRAGRSDEAAWIRSIFRPLEDLRNSHGPIPVLHAATAAAGIADTGPPQPLLADLPERVLARVDSEARALVAADRQLATAAPLDDAATVPSAGEPVSR
jgi:dihydrodipicolinate synthase/N-acetylneuraminate lyase